MSLPPPLPPETRTVGQLVAETIQLYRRRFWPSLALGIGPALTAVLTAELSGAGQLAAALVAGPVLVGSSLVGAALLASDVRARPRVIATAFAAAAIALLPLLLARVVAFPGVYLLVLGWFALTGIAAPAAIVEGRGLGPSLRRGVDLARADFVHALGSIATFVILIVVTDFALVLLLAGFGENTLPIAAFLALLVLSPIFFLGTALLYFDQAARVVDSGPRTPRPRRSDADVHHADDADGPRRADAQVEPGAAARGQP